MAERLSFWFQRLLPGLFVLLWSTGFIGTKMGLVDAEPFTFLLLRFSSACLLLLGIALVLRRPWPINSRHALHIMIAGVLLQGGYLGGVFSAIHLGLPAGLTALIVGMQPLLTGLLSARLLGERIGMRQWAGLVLGFIGVALVLSGRVSLAGFSPLGVTFALLALASITCGTLYQKHFCGHMDLWSGSLLQFAASAIVVLPLALAFETMQVNWGGSFLFALGWLVLVLSVGAVSLLHILIRRGAATRVATLFYLTPPTTALMAWAMFGERLTIQAMAGMALAVAGVAMALKR